MSQEKPSDRNQPAVRMDMNYPYQFNCLPGVPCFTECCQDVTIVLTPYDVLRLKNRLGISSDYFLKKFTIVLRKEKQLVPLVILKMNEASKKCQFVSSEGCTVYEDRPWPCRMYPLDLEADGSFRLLMDRSRCRGLAEERVIRLGDWMAEQGVETYDDMNELFTQLTALLQVQSLDVDNPQIAQMIFMALYSLDKFKEFVFNSSFLGRLEVEPERVEKIKEDDIELLKFAYDWIKFGLFGEKLFWVKDQKAD